MRSRPSRGAPIGGAPALGPQHRRRGSPAARRTIVPGPRLAARGPAVTRCSAPCWRPSYSRSTVASVSISSARLVRPQVRDPREAQREPRLVAGRAHDHVERDLDHDRRLDDPVAAVDRDRVGLEPPGHLGDLGVGQAAVRLADGDQPAAWPRRGPRRCSRTARRGACRGPTSTPTTTQSIVASAFFIFSQPRPRRPGE